MIYLTWAETGLDETTLLQLTDDEGAGTVRQDVVEEMIADAEAEIDSYGRSRYSVPFSPVPTVIKSVCRTLVQFALFSRRPDAAIPEGILKRYERAISWLKDFSAGKVSIEAQINLSEDERTASAGKVTGGKRTFGRDNLDDF